MGNVEEKNLPFAIGLNFVLPGAGYMYMGKWIVGVLAFLLVMAIYTIAGLFSLLSAWIVMNIIMALDMIIASKKNKEKYLKENTIKCPSCAELIQKEAKICRYCNRSIVE